jgi:hypothetical protein
VTFDEQVIGVSGSTFRLRRVDTGRRVAASVSYDGSTRTASLVASEPLRPGRYELVLRRGITDRALNPLRPSRWTFRVIDASQDASQGG